MSGLVANSWRAGSEAAEQHLLGAGLDLIKWFSTAEANKSLDSEHRLPQTGGVALIVGNTRAVWQPFFEWKRTHPDVTDPFDTYVESEIESALRPLSPTWLRFGHHLTPAPIPIQRYAAASGLARMSPVGLSIHPIYGPWFALRAVAIFEFPEVPARAASEHPQSPCAHPCDACARPCLAPFDEAMQARSTATRRFLPVRMSCPVGANFQYGPAQLDYHYGCGLVGEP